MGSIPPGFSLDRLIGQQLCQICIGSCNLQFRFHLGDVVSCTGQVAVELDGKPTVVFAGDQPWWPDVTPLPCLPGRDVVSWRVEGSHEFSITLDGEARLWFQSTDDPHEEFGIYPDQQIV